MHSAQRLSWSALGRSAVLLWSLILFGGNSLAQQCLSGGASPSAPVRKLFVVAGQSNAVGLASVKDITQGPKDLVRDTTVFPNVKIYGIYGAQPGVAGNDDAVLSKSVPWSRFASWQVARPGFGYKNVASAPEVFPAGVSAKEVFGPELYLARFLNERAPYEHYIVKLAVSNTSLNFVADADNWAPGSHLFGELMKMIASAYSDKSSVAQVQVAGLFFMQGETDALHEYWAKNYKNNLIEFIEKFRQSMVRMGCAKDYRIPVVIGRIQDNSVWKFRKYVRNAQEQVSREILNVTLVNTDDFSEHLVVGGVHFDEYGQARLGERVYRAFYPLLGRKKDQ